MGSFITLGTIQTALELGVIYSLVALALFLSFSMLNVCDLSTDSCFTLGCAVGSMVAIAGHPILAIFAAMGAGILSGYLTALLQTKLGVESILAGIIVNTGLYTINIFIMGKSILNLNTTTTVFTLARDLLKGSPLEDWSRLIVAVLFVGVIAVLLAFFLHTRLGLSIRATGDNEDMVKASSINPSLTIIVGLCVANAMTALSGCLLGEYQKSCDINMGTGMVTIALASLIIGETLMGRHPLPHRRSPLRLLPVPGDRGHRHALQPARLRPEAGLRPDRGRGHRLPHSAPDGGVPEDQMAAEKPVRPAEGRCKPGKGR